MTVEIILVPRFYKNLQRFLLQSVFNSCPVFWRNVYDLVLCVIYVSVTVRRAGGERVEQKSIPSVAYLWLHQTGGEGLVMRSNRVTKKKWKGAESGPRGGAEDNMKCMWIDMNGGKAQGLKLDAASTAADYEFVL